MLMAGPYRRGTDDDPAYVAANRPQLETAAQTERTAIITETLYDEQQLGVNEIT